MKKELRPLWATTVDPSEYNIDEQLKEWLEQANENKLAFQDIDVGKLWGLYEAYKSQPENIFDEVLGILRQLRRRSNGYDYETLTMAIAQVATLKESTVLKP